MLVVGAVEDVVERLDLAVDAAAVLRVDHRIAREIEDVARDDHVGAPEHDDAVAVGDGVRLVEQLDAVVVMRFAAALLEIRVARHRLVWRLRVLQAVRDVVVRDDRRVPQRIGEQASHRPRR